MELPLQIHVQVEHLLRDVLLGPLAHGVVVRCLLIPARQVGQLVGKASCLQHCLSGRPGKALRAVKLQMLGLEVQV